VKWGNLDAPQWTIEQAMQAISLLDKPFRDNGYALTLHGSVLVKGRGNDLDLIAVPMELSVTPPEEMEHIMCEILGASALPEEPRHGLLRTWARPCILSDGRQIDIEYPRPAPADRRTETIAPFISVFWQNGYHLELCSFPSQIGGNYLELIALPVRSNVMSPQDMDRILCETFHARPGGGPSDGFVWGREYLLPDGWGIGIRYLPPADQHF
jgi:hypothetical protein